MFKKQCQKYVVYLTVYNDSAKHSYINYMDRDISNWINAYHHIHQQRLINIKNTYHKNNRFDFERTIETAHSSGEIHHIL